MPKSTTMFTKNKISHHLSPADLVYLDRSRGLLLNTKVSRATFYNPNLLLLQSIFALHCCRRSDQRLQAVQAAALHTVGLAEPDG